MFILWQTAQSCTTLWAFFSLMSLEKKCAMGLEAEQKCAILGAISGYHAFTKYILQKKSCGFLLFSITGLLPPNSCFDSLVLVPNCDSISVLRVLCALHVELQLIDFQQKGSGRKKKTGKESGCVQMCWFMCICVCMCACVCATVYLCPHCITTIDQQPWPTQFVLLSQQFICSILTCR